MTGNTDRLLARLTEWAAGFARKHSVHEFEFQPPRIPFSEREASGFLRALDEGFILVDDAGRCSFEGIHVGPTRPTQPGLFGKKAPIDGIIRLQWREYVTQISAGADLVFDYGWPRDQVAPADPGDWAFDVAAYDSPSMDASMVIAGEVKKSTAELSRTLTGILECVSGGVVPAPDSSLPGHKNYAGFLNNRPSYFWAVSPQERRAFTVSFDGTVVTLKEVDDPPHYMV